MAATSYEDGQNLSSEKFARNHGTKHKNSTTVFQKERSIYRSQKTQKKYCSGITAQKNICTPHNLQRHEFQCGSISRKVLDQQLSGGTTANDESSLVMLEVENMLLRKMDRIQQLQKQEDGGIKLQYNQAHLKLISDQINSNEEVTVLVAAMQMHAYEMN